MSQAKEHQVGMNWMVAALFVVIAFVVGLLALWFVPKHTNITYPDQTQRTPTDQARPAPGQAAPSETR